MGGALDPEGTPSSLDDEEEELEELEELEEAVRVGLATAGADV